MGKYYNAEALLEFVKQNTPHFDGETTLKCVERSIKEAPTADVVEVVRCKDCKHQPNLKTSTKGMMWCRKFRNEVTAIDYCSYGIRKENNE